MTYVAVGTDEHVVGRKGAELMRFEKHQLVVHSKINHDEPIAVFEINARWVI